jgi:hypothetical protein
MNWDNSAPPMSRRSVLSAGWLGMLGMVGQSNACQTVHGELFFKTRGVVITPNDLTLGDWEQRAKQADLTTIALHPFPSMVLKFVQSDDGKQFLGKCDRLGLQVEYELHAMRELLPRSLFSHDKSLFRMNEKHERIADANLCVHSTTALDIAAENALKFARSLTPTTGRYFFWGDDGQPWCRCDRCRGLTDSDQALMFENHLIRALRSLNPKASLAHLAYANTLSPPSAVKPEPGIFLEYAPIKRRYDIPYKQQTAPDQQDALSALDANLKVFPADTAHVLEYWLDVSRFSGWKRPAVKLPWRRDVLESDLETYGSRGIRHITSFAVYVDAEYRQRFGEPTFVNEYGAMLSAFRRR